MATPSKAVSVCYYHVTYEYQRESILYSFLKFQGNPFLKQALYLKFSATLLKIYW